MRVRSWPLVILAVLAVFGALHLGRAFFVPIAAATVLAYLLLPAVAGLTRLGLHPRVAAGAVMILLTGAAVGGLVRLHAPAVRWVEELPRVLRDAEPQLRSLREPVDHVSEAARSLETIAGDADEPGRIEVTSTRDGVLGGWILTSLTELLAGMVVTGFLLFFLLGNDHAFLRGLVRAMPSLTEKRIAVGIVHKVEKQIARYLATITLINASLGVAIALATYALGLPNPALWGVLAAMLNFVPYVGAVIGVLVVGLVALATSESPGEIVAPPLAYAALTSLEGMLITPMILGRRFLLRPTIVFVWLVLWSALWGIPGALLASPLLVIAKIVCDNLPSLEPIAVFLGRDAYKDRRDSPAAGPSAL